MAHCIELIGIYQIEGRRWRRRGRAVTRLIWQLTVTLGTLASILSGRAESRTFELARGRESLDLLELYRPKVGAERHLG